jgi:hypothetical protein
MLKQRPVFGGLQGVLCALVLSACGGGGGDDAGGGTTPPPPPQGGTPLTAGVPGLVGDWLENGCVAAGAQSFKRLTRATDLSANSIRYASGVYSYANTNCAGAGSLVGPSNLGTVVFSRAESNALVAASWGVFTTVTNTTSAVIWAKKRENLLCLLGDETPSIQPTLADVAASLSTLPESACFTQQ